jgi:hypothetical protein
MKVYNVLGHEVIALVNEEKPSGPCYVRSSAQNLSSGMYVYCIKADDFVATKGMILSR